MMANADSFQLKKDRATDGPILSYTYRDGLNQVCLKEEQVCNLFGLKREATIKKGFQFPFAGAQDKEALERIFKVEISRDYGKAVAWVQEHLQVDLEQFMSGQLARGHQDNGPGADRIRKDEGGSPAKWKGEDRDSASIDSIPPTSPSGPPHVESEVEKKYGVDSKPNAGCHSRKRPHVLGESAAPGCADVATGVASQKRPRPSSVRGQQNKIVQQQLQGKAGKLRAEVNRSKAQIAALEQQRQEAHSQVAAVRAELEMLQGQCREVKKSVTTMEADISRLQGARDEAANQAEQARREAQGARQAALKELGELYGQREEVLASVSALTQQKAQLQAEVGKLQAAKADAEKQCEEAQQAAAVAQARRLQESVQQQQQPQAEAEPAGALLQVLSAAEAQHAQHGEAAAAKNVAVLAELQAAVQAAVRQLGEAGRAASAAGEAEEKLRKLGADREQLAKEVGKLLGQQSQLQSDLLILRGEQAQLQANLNKWKGSSEQQAGQFEEIKQAIVASKDARQKAQEQLRAVMVEVSKLEGSLGRLREQELEISTRAKELGEVVDKLRQEKGELEGSVQYLKKTAVDLEKESLLAKRYEGLGMHVKAQEQQLKVLQQQRAELEKEKAALEADVGTLRLRQEVKVLEERKAQLQAQAVSLMNETEKLMAEAAFARVEAGKGLDGIPPEPLPPLMQALAQQQPAGQQPLPPLPPQTGPAQQQPTGQQQLLLPLPSLPLQTGPAQQQSTGQQPLPQSLQQPQPPQQPQPLPLLLEALAPEQPTGQQPQVIGLDP